MKLLVFIYCQSLAQDLTNSEQKNKCYRYLWRARYFPMSHQILSLHSIGYETRQKIHK